MRARIIMTKDVITMKPDTIVNDAILILISNKISGAPVVDNQNNIIGIVSEKDLLVTLDFLGGENAKKTVVEEFMSKDIISVSEDEPIEEISRLLVKMNIKRVPVLSGGKVIGIISRRDILRAAVEH